MVQLYFFYYYQYEFSFHFFCYFLFLFLFFGSMKENECGFTRIRIHSPGYCYIFWLLVNFCLHDHSRNTNSAVQKNTVVLSCQRCICCLLAAILGAPARWLVIGREEGAVLRQPGVREAVQVGQGQHHLTTLTQALLHLKPINYMKKKKRTNHWRDWCRWRQY